MKATKHNLLGGLFVAAALALFALAAVTGCRGEAATAEVGADDHRTRSRHRSRADVRRPMAPARPPAAGWRRGGSCPAA